MKKQKQDNFLSYLPEKNPKFSSRLNDDGRIVLTVPHTGVFDKIAQVLFFQPKQTYLKLDALGSFVWRQIDGSITVEELAQRVDREFGEDAAPLYDRLVAFLQILHRNRFITFQKKQ